jgi:hypothetical protein
MGVGSPDDLLMAIGEGVDLFDCTLPTRMARAGSLLTRQGRRNLRNARYRADPAPPDPSCDCAVCARYPAATLHWLFQEEHALGGRLATYHNLAFLSTLLREARAATTLGRWRVPEGAHVLLGVYHVQHDARHFPEPERFMPERFAPAAAARLHPGAYLPFGAGTRACIGKRFALLEATLLLATLYQRLRFELAQPAPELAADITLAPRGGLRMRVLHRSS